MFSFTFFTKLQIIKFQPQLTIKIQLLNSWLSVMIDNSEHAGESMESQAVKTSNKELDGVDINEAFERLLFAEELAEEVGYKEGYEAGTRQIIKGYHLGYHRASLLAARLGYYYGILQYCLNNEEFSEKVKRQATKLQIDLENFPHGNVDSIDILSKVEDIKFKYKQLCSLAKIDSTYPEDDKLDY